ncbi:MAG: 2-amino-4-hydroxy-6-hydroxymethyldihydropteridine diphosphokinase [Planctomycetota bacterium]
MTRAWLALGSNVGDRSAAIEGAVARLGELSRTTVAAVSSMHETEPVGGPAGQAAYLNAAVGIDTTLSPRELLDATQAIEAGMGRAPVGERVKDGPRVIDIDVLMAGDAVIDEPGLRVPHPRMSGRAFVLGPLAEIAAEVVHPVTGLTVGAMLASLGEPVGGVGR